MLTIEMTSDSGLLEFNTVQSVSVYINDKQIVTIGVSQLLNKNDFNILFNGEKIFVSKVEIIYR